MVQKDTRRAVALIYSTNGLPFGILNEALPLLLHQLHLGAGLVGLAQLLQLPWTFKVLWAPAVDRTGTLAGWLKNGATVLSFSFFCLGAACFYSCLPAIFVAAAVCAATAATLDLTADATFVRLVTSGRIEESTGGGLRTTAYKGGLMLGSGLTVALAGLFGWSMPFFLLAGWTFLIRTRSSDGAACLPKQPRLKSAEWRAAMQTWFAVPGTKALLLFILVYKLALASAAPMAKYALVEAGLPLVSVGASLALLGFAGISLGAATAVYTIRRWDLRWALLLGSASEAVACLGYALASLAAPVGLPGWPAWACCGLLEAWAQGLTTTTLGALITRHTDQRFAATHFGLMTSLFGLTRACGGPLGGVLVAHFGLFGFFAIAPLLALASLWPLWRLWPRLPQLHQMLDPP